MTPYYQDEWCTIYHADCRDVLPALRGVGQVLTSPPYNLGRPPGTSGQSWRALSDGYGAYGDDLPHAEYVAWQQTVLQLCWETLTDSGAIYYQHKPLAKGNDVRLPFELNPGLPLRQVITWDRGSGFVRQYTHYVPRYEWILLFAKPGFRITSRDVDDLWKIVPEAGSDHPAPFPLSLARRAIGTTSAGVVLDPFAGSGTTLRAARDLGRKAIGIELEERFCEMAANRLAQGVLDLGAAV